MGVIYWLLIGLAAGAVAKIVTPQDEKGGWVSSLVIGLLGSMVGGFLAGVIGLNRMFNASLLGSFILALAGALLLLYVYHKHLKDKLNINL